MYIAKVRNLDIDYLIFKLLKYYKIIDPYIQIRKRQNKGFLIMSYEYI